MEKQKFCTHNLNIPYKRPWGYYTVITEQDGFLAKIIHVNPHQRLSVQSHNYRSEHWFVVKGVATVILDEKELQLQAGESIDINIKQIHSLQNNTDNDVEIIEVQRGSILSEDDIIRYKDIYGRA